MDERRTSPAAEQGPRLERATDERSAQRFAEVVGPRAALLGDELGCFEAWIWPLKVLRRLEPSFTSAGAGPISAAQASRSIEVAPHEVALRYAGPDWSATLTWFAALEERALVGLVEVQSERELLVSIDLEPELRPMWPAGLGGQFAGTDPDTGALLISEELGRYAVLCGSLEAEPVRADSDHSLPRDPVQIALRIPPVRAKRGPVPIVLVGADVEPPPLTEAARRGEEGAARGESRSARALQEARALFWKASKDWPRWRVEARERLASFLERTVRFESPDSRFDAAFLWAKLAIERAWTEVQPLGRGLVAGLAHSRGGDRPGFGWFFDGDAMIAARAQAGCGDFAGAREVLRFAASHQREDGKLMHELVLSAGLCRWVEDYPYAYYKAPNTPAFLAVLAHYVAASGDLELARELWPNALRAFEHAWRSLDEDGLFSVQKAGLAAVEAGPLVGALRSEVYVHGIWISAAKGLADLAGLLGEPQVQQRARHEADRAEAAFESFWSEERGRYGFARRTDGSLCDDLTAYLALPLARGIGQPERAAASALALNLPEVASDWGPRLFATDSSVYQPGNYNCGSVFPYLANHAVLALYRHGLGAAGWQTLASQVALSDFSGLGLVPEHLAGDTCDAPVRGVPHQIFSSATIVQSTLYGLFGLAGNAVEGALLVRPTLPPHWEYMALRGLRLGESRLDLEVARKSSVGSSTLTLRATLHAGPPLKLFFRPWLPALTRGVDQRLGFAAAPHPVAMESCGASLSPQGGAGIELARGSEQITYGCELGPEVLLGTTEPLEPGRASRGVRLCGVRPQGDLLGWTFQGPQGSEARLRFRSDRAVKVKGAQLADGALRVSFPASDKEFSTAEVELEAEP
jgi:Mannosylglycerate hydrolase MGH1-like glycoside hydrolase domain